MKTYIKIVMAGVNVVCLLITLLYPNSATPISLLPVIVTTTSWVFLSQKTTLSKIVDKRRREYLIFSTVLAVICVVIGITCRINQSSCGAEYSISFALETALIGGFSFDYVWFAGSAFLAILFLLVAEVVASHRSQLRRDAENNPKSMHELVNETINSSAPKGSHRK